MFHISPFSWEGFPSTEQEGAERELPQLPLPSPVSSQGAPRVPSWCGGGATEMAPAPRFSLGEVCAMGCGSLQGLSKGWGCGHGCKVGFLTVLSSYFVVWASDGLTGKSGLCQFGEALAPFPQALPTLEPCSSALLHEPTPKNSCKRPPQIWIPQGIWGMAMLTCFIPTSLKIISVSESSLMFLKV